MKRKEDWQRTAFHNALVAWTDPKSTVEVMISFVPAVALVRVPTMVIHRSGDLCLKVEEGRFVAS